MPHFFVLNTGSDTDAYFHSFVHLITDLGHPMGKSITIEGAETPEQLRHCIDTKADVIQRYYFPPMPREDLLKTVTP